MSATTMDNMLREAIEETDAIIASSEAAQEPEIVASANEEENNLFWNVTLSAEKNEECA